MSFIALSSIFDKKTHKTNNVYAYWSNMETSLKSLYNLDSVDKNVFCCYGDDVTIQEIIQQHNITGNNSKTHNS